MAFLNTEHRDDGFAVLRFDKPNSKVNILSRETWEELHSALRALRARPGVKGLILASVKPDIFIAGADLKFFADVPTPNDDGVKSLIALGLKTLDILENLTFPTVALIDGATLGGGLEVALAADFRLVGTNPRIELGLPEIKLGLIPGWGGTQRLTRLIELETAVEMLLGGKSLNASEALKVRLIDAEPFPNDPLESAIQFLVTCEFEPIRRAKREELPLLDRELLKEAMLARPPAQSEAERELRSVILRGGEQPLVDALTIESAAFLRLAGSDESKAKINEFFAVRKK